MPVVFLATCLLPYWLHVNEAPCFVCITILIITFIMIIMLIMIMMMMMIISTIVIVIIIITSSTFINVIIVSLSISLITITITSTSTSTSTVSIITIAISIISLLPYWLHVNEAPRCGRFAYIMYGFYCNFNNLRFNNTQHINDFSAAQVSVSLVSRDIMKGRSLK